MKSIWIILIWLILYLGFPIPLLPSVSWWNRVIFYWMLLNVLICIYELAMVINRYQMTITNYWSHEYPFTSSLTPEFWLDGWAEYSRFDPRYLDDQNYVHLIELGNVIITLIPSLIIMVAILNNNISPEIYRLALIVSIYQLVVTTIYYVTLIPSAIGKYWLYVIFDLPWVVMPIVTIMWAKKNLSTIWK